MNKLMCLFCWALVFFADLGDVLIEQSDQSYRACCHLDDGRPPTVLLRIFSHHDHTLEILPVQLTLSSN